MLCAAYRRVWRASRARFCSVAYQTLTTRRNVLEAKGWFSAVFIVLSSPSIQGYNKEILMVMRDNRKSSSHHVFTAAEITLCLNYRSVTLSHTVAFMAVIINAHFHLSSASGPTWFPRVHSVCVTRWVCSSLSVGCVCEGQRPTRCPLSRSNRQLAKEHRS